MKVLMWGRSDLRDYIGGDRVQIENTASALRSLGVDVDVSTDVDADVGKYDIVHIFQLDWTPETYFYALAAKQSKKPIVLSPIHHSIEEVNRFDNEYVFDFRRISKYLFRDQHNRDTFKNIYRSLFNVKKIRSTVMSLFIGLSIMHKRALKMSDVVLVQTNLEAKDLARAYNVDFRWEKVQNGVGRHFLDCEHLENTLEINDYIISVGRIEPRKNTLRVIEAVRRVRESFCADIALVLVGKESKNHPEFLFWFRKALKKYGWVKHIEQIPNQKIPSLYHFAKVCVSASWFETTGLTLLEALFCGTNAVASGSRAKEYLGDFASYCDPGDVDSIADAIAKEYFAKRPVVPEEMRSAYTWDHAAKKIKEIYESLVIRL